MKAIKNNRLVYALIFGLILSCSPREPEVINLCIVQTSDVHGAIFPYDFTSENSSQGSLAQVFQLVNEMRGQYKDSFILLDNGDIIQGDPASYYTNFVSTDSLHLFSRAMNFMGYDAATIGNHDLEGGHPVYDRLISESHFPWLAANALKNSDSTPYFQAYTILHKAGLKVAVLGLVTPHIPRWLPSFLYEGMYFDDMVSSAQKWVDQIMQEEKPDILIGLFHSGIDTSGNISEPFIEQASAAVAQKVKGFDLILAGHDHKGWDIRLPGPEGDTVILLAPTSRAKDVAIAELTYRKDRSGKINKEWKTRILAINHLPPDSTFMAHFEADFYDVLAYVEDSVGYLSSDIPFPEALFGPSEAVDLIHRVQLQASGAQISLAASMSYKGQLSHGPIRVRDLFRLYRYENYLYTMHLSGNEIDKFLEYATGRWFNQMKSADDFLLIYKLDASGEIVYRGEDPVTQEPFYNYSTAAGIHYTVDLRKPVGDRVEIHRTADGRPFDPAKVYAVTLNSYRGNGGGGHLTDGAGISPDSLRQRIIWCSDREIRSLIVDYLKTGPIRSPGYRSWTLVPEEWWEKARKRELDLWKSL